MNKKTSEQQSSQGLVIAYYGNSVAVETDDGRVVQCHLRRNQVLPVVGDCVTWQQNTEDAGIIIDILPRRSLLMRGNGQKQLKPIAANIDTLVIVMAPPPIFSEYLIDRYLVAAELLNLKAIIVLNKIDLLTDATREAAIARMQAYQQIAYQAALTTIVFSDGLDELSVLLKGRAAVLIGPSGVGKSSIIAALSHAESIRIGDVSTKGAGKHTTTATRLYHLPQGGSLIDSPGVREFNLWPVSKQDILRGFKEFQPYLGGCKFRDCQHLAEPSCTVQAAVQAGKISRARYTNYQILMKEAK